MTGSPCPHADLITLAVETPSGQFPNAYWKHCIDRKQRERDAAVHSCQMLEQQLELARDKVSVGRNSSLIFHIPLALNCPPFHLLYFDSQSGFAG